MYEFYKNFLSINLKDYENIGIDLEVSKVLLGLLIGIIIASIVVCWQRNSMLLLIKRLKRLGCVSEAEAKTLCELGINSLGVRTLIRTSSRVERMVMRVGKTEYTYEEYTDLLKKKKKKKGDAHSEDESKRIEDKIDFSVARFYLKDPEADDTKNVLEKNSSSLLNTLLMCVMMVAIYTILLFLMPDILSFINSLLG